MESKWKNYHIIIFPGWSLSQNRDIIYARCFLWRQNYPDGHILRRNCLLKQVIEGKIKGEMEVTRRRGRRRRKLLYDLKDRRGYSHLKEEALDRTMWRARFGRSFGPVVRQNTEWMNEFLLGMAVVITLSELQKSSYVTVYKQIPYLLRHPNPKCARSFSLKITAIWYPQISIFKLHSLGYKCGRQSYLWSSHHFVLAVKRTQ